MSRPSPAIAPYGCFCFVQFASDILLSPFRSVARILNAIYIVLLALYSRTKRAGALRESLSPRLRASQQGAPVWL